MHNLKLTRSYLNYSLLNRFTSLISSNDCLAAFSTEASNNSRKSSEEPSGNADIFGTLAAKTEEQKISKLTRSVNKPSKNYRQNTVISNTTSNRESDASSKRSNHQDEKDGEAKTLVNKRSFSWKKTTGDDRNKIRDKVPYETDANSSNAFELSYPKPRWDREGHTPPKRSNPEEQKDVFEKTTASQRSPWRKTTGDVRNKIQNKDGLYETDPNSSNAFGLSYPKTRWDREGNTPPKQKDVFEKTVASQRSSSWRKIAGDARNKIQNKVPHETDPRDTFGLLYRNTRSDPDEDQGDEGDTMDEMRAKMQRPVYNKPANSYGTEIYQLIKQNKLGEALVHFKKMREIDMVKPDHFIYATLICGCGQKGFTSMAFKLHKEMKEYGIKVEDIIYTGLFNSCGNSPFPKYGLKQAQQLYERITNQQIALNGKNYHAAIKAFGRCGDLQMAFRLIDEMVEKGLVVTTETFSFILMGCISDKKSGFLQAIRVWRKMQEKRVRPNVYSYNLLLRATRDCNLGKMELAERILLDTFNSDLNLESSNLNINYLPESKSPSFPLQLVSQSIMQLPDVLSTQSNTSNVMQLIEPKTPQEKFALLGGLKNILTRMLRDQAKPDLKTFTEFLELIPSDNAVEDDLLAIMKYMKVDPDVDFYNVLIKKKNLRKDFKGAKEVLSLIGKDNLYPDIATFGTLAIGCSTLQMAQTFLNDLKMAGFRPNIQIMGALVHQGCYRRQFHYVIEMLKVIKMEKIRPSTLLIDKLEKCVSTTKMSLVKREKEGTGYAPDDPFIQSFELFLKYYKYWLKSTELEITDDPWASYRIPKENEVNVNKDEIEK